MNTDKTGTEWRSLSDAYAHQILEALRRAEPELMTALGMTGAETETLLLPREDIQIEVFARLERVMEYVKTQETHPGTLFDVGILHDAARARREQLEAERVLAPWRAVSETMLTGMSAAVAPEHRPVRLKRYIGTSGAPALVEQAIGRLREAIESGLVMPCREAILDEYHGARRRLIDIRRIFGLAAGDDRRPFPEEELDILGAQIGRWRDFLHEKVLPIARSDHRLPEEIYVQGLVRYGVEMPMDKLIGRARALYKEIDDEMHEITTAAKRGTMLDAMREIHAEQLAPGVARGVYQEWATRLRSLVDSSGFATLPKREVIVSVGESGAHHEPYLFPPPILGPQQGPLVFLLPGSILTGPPERRDFLAPAIAPSLVLEQILGHGLHLGAVSAAGLTKARLFLDFGEAFFAGWPIYAADELSRSLPRDVRLVVLHRRALVAARAFLDAGLHMGELSPEDARKVLTDELGLAPERARGELGEMLWRSPGKGPARLAGFFTLRDLRAEAEKREGKEFKARTFHDRLLGAGFLSPQRLRNTMNPMARKNQ